MKHIEIKTIASIASIRKRRKGDVLGQSLRQKIVSRNIVCTLE